MKFQSDSFYTGSKEVKELKEEFDKIDEFWKKARNIVGDETRKFNAGNIRRFCKKHNITYVGNAMLLYKKTYWSKVHYIMMKEVLDKWKKEKNCE